MASRISSWSHASISRIVSRSGFLWNNSGTSSNSLYRLEPGLSDLPLVSPEGGLRDLGLNNAKHSTFLSSLRRALTSTPQLGATRLQTFPGLLAAKGVPCTQQVRSIMVEVKGNDLDRAIRKWKRRCKEENLRNLKDREYHIKPSEKKILAAKERDRRSARRAFKQKLNWILTRRQRGF